MLCEKCNTQTEDGKTLCAACEEQSSAAQTTTSETSQADETAGEPTRKKKSPILLFILIGIGIVLLGLLTVFFFVRSDAVNYTSKLIDNLGEVTLESQENIEKAQNAYNKLGFFEKLQVFNAGELDNAKIALDECKVEEAEEAITAIGTVTLNSEAAIKKADETYSALVKSLQKQVENAADLETAKKTFFDLQVKEVDEKIAAIGKVTLDSKNAIDLAADAYDKASAEVQAAVQNANLLTEAKDTFKTLRAENATSLIDKIGKVTLQKKSAVEKAEEAYKALSADEKALVKNADKLTQARKTLDELQKKKDEEALAKALSSLQKEYDPYKGVTFYKCSTQPKYADIRSYILPCMGVGDEGTSRLVMIYLYTGDDWIFFDRITFLVDGVRYTKTFSYSEVERDNDYGDVWEYCQDISVTDSDVAMLWDIIGSTNTTLRFSGSRGTYEMTIGYEDKVAMKQLLTAYELMNK